MSNRINFQGRLGAEPETKTVGDTTVTRIRVAESESYKDKSGEKQEKTCWWNCDIWGRSGETVAQYFSKGDGIIIEGSVRQDVRENEEGKRTFYSVRVNRWEFPMSRNGGETAAPKPRASARPDATDDDEIPF